MIKIKEVKLLLLSITVSLLPFPVFAEDGYRLWQRYEPIENAALLKNYRQSLTEVIVAGHSPTVTVLKNELQLALPALLGNAVAFPGKAGKKGALVIATPANSAAVKALNLSEKLKELGEEGFLITSTEINGKQSTLITANTDIGLLYGTFHFLRLIQTHQPIQNLSISSTPKIKHRVLNHWDNLDRTVERG